MRSKNCNRAAFPRILPRGGGKIAWEKRALYVHILK